MTLVVCHIADTLLIHDEEHYPNQQSSVSCLSMWMAQIVCTHTVAVVSRRTCPLTCGLIGSRLTSQITSAIPRSWACAYACTSDRKKSVRDVYNTTMTMNMMLTMTTTTIMMIKTLSQCSANIANHMISQIVSMSPRFFSIVTTLWYDIIFQWCTNILAKMWN